MKLASLSAAEQGIWLGQAIKPASPMYNTAEYIEFNGEFDKQPTKRLQVKWATEYYKVLFKDNSKPNSKD